MMNEDGISNISSSPREVEKSNVNKQKQVKQRQQKTG